MCERYKFTFKGNWSIVALKGSGTAIDEAPIRPIHSAAMCVYLALNACGGQ